MPSLGILLFAAITVAPPGASMPPRGSQTFNATGGTAPYSYAFVSNASGASLEGSSYSAGAKGDVQDVLRVTDAAGDTRTISVLVGPGVSIAPSGVRLAPHGSQVFTPQGGSGLGFRWTLEGSGSFDDGRYVAAASGGATLHVVDSLGNSGSATILIGPDVALDPVDVSVSPGASVTFAATGGSGAYRFSLEPTPSLSGGSIHPSSGLYIAGPKGSVDDVVVLTDDVGNRTTGLVHVLAGPPPSEVTTTTTDGTQAPSGSGAGLPPKHSVNLAGGGTADNACDCGTVGARSGVASSALVVTLAGLLAFVVRRRAVRRK